jgi:hypothetical protein
LAPASSRLIWPGWLVSTPHARTERSGPSPGRRLSDGWNRWPPPLVSGFQSAPKCAPRFTGAVVCFESPCRGRVCWTVVGSFGTADSRTDEPRCCLSRCLLICRASVYRRVDASIRVRGGSDVHPRSVLVCINNPAAQANPSSASTSSRLHLLKAKGEPMYHKLQTEPEMP